MSLSFPADPAVWQGKVAGLPFVSSAWHTGHACSVPSDADMAHSCPLFDWLQQELSAAFLQPGLRELCCSPLSSVLHPAAGHPLTVGSECAGRTCHGRSCSPTCSPWSQALLILLPAWGTPVGRLTSRMQRVRLAGGSLARLRAASQPVSLALLCSCVVRAPCGAHACCAVQVFTSHSEPHSSMHCCA